ncbi:helix-turn-helix domain-containing protein [Lichenifustis flavocetrariae]|uniref:Transcriptional regulator n=1 Tax=Lichenifustis flavocetrariae TaxID=2949735 RepID=A0AA42CNJ2_9HYPH|nr:helix-turn-helix domain-containing protein [Lichenifustis flavocetrariae]MCW6512856.1 transcriptional regulator [Lichenifustis flavocetrariae]
MVNAITARQCRMARAALDWSQLELARMSGIGSTSIKKFELGAKLRPHLLSELRRSMEAAGIEFIEEGAVVRGKLVAFGVFLSDQSAASAELAVGLDGAGDS